MSTASPFPTDPPAATRIIENMNRIGIKIKWTSTRKAAWLKFDYQWKPTKRSKN